MRNRASGPSSFKKIVFYVEGGRGPGDSREFRRAFHKFFEDIEKAARDHQIRMTVVMCGSRRTTYERYCEAVNQGSDLLPILLVDSEAPINEAGKPWLHLSKRVGDGWKKP